jgi:hypothetical protein
VTLKPPSKFDIPFGLGDTVIVDGDGSLHMRVTALCWRATMPEVEVSWMHNGSMNSSWVPPWRLSLEAPETGK